jgi:uncharacterized protein YprB with RNaseH-like and TPR domain
VSRPPLGGSGAEFVNLASAVPGIEVVDASGGRSYLISNPADSLADGCPDISQRFIRRFEDTQSSLPRRLAALCQADHVAPSDLIFLDLETCGLSNAPVFLGGVMLWEESRLVVRQFLARDYSEEAAITRRLLEVLAGGRLLVTFNGKTFDLPFLVSRALANGIRPRVRIPHLDLLHEARRAWRSGVPNCKLQTLEAHICGRRRTDDLPGSEVPEAYHAFVRTGNAFQVAQILHHNALDLATLAELLIKLPSGESRQD